MTADPEIAAKNEKTLRQIALAVFRSQGHFKLMRLRCDYRQAQHYWAERLQSFCAAEYGLDLPCLELKPDNIKLFSQLQDFLTDQPTPLGGIQVMGFESLNDRPNAFGTLNLIRESLQDLSLPVLWWLDERSLIDLMHYANDLHSWSTGKQFLTDAQSIEQLISYYADQLYRVLEQGTSDQWVGEWPIWSEIDRQEIEYVKGEFREEKAGFFTEFSELFQANFHVVLGRWAYEGGDWQGAEDHWRSMPSLTPNPWRSFHLGLALLKQAEQDDTRQEEAETWLEQSCQSLPQLNHCHGIVLLRGWRRSSPTRAIADLSPEELDRCIAALEPIAEFHRVGFPQLHRRALARLEDLHFQRENYGRAFDLRQKRQEVERFYGLRAFIGAGRLNAQMSHRYGEALVPEIEQSGRGEDVNALLERIGGNTYRIIVIQGPSGVGKSSLVNAGLIPALGQVVMGGQGCYPVVIRRYKEWMEELRSPLPPLNKGGTGSGSESSGELRSPLAPLNKGGTGTGSEVPLNKGDLGGFLDFLREQTRRNLRPVLIFDQFEEFFFAHPSLRAQRQFFEFLGQILADVDHLLSTKIVLSLRRDYLHLLLVCNSIEGMKAISQDILSRQVLYGIDNLTPDRTRRVITTLTQNAQFPLEADLVEQLVTDLAGEEGVRPIELQIVGSQLQESKIQTLEAYQALGDSPKQTLVQDYLQSVVRACGPAQEKLADLVLYGLSDDQGTRPLQTRPEILKAVEVVAQDEGWTEEILEEKLTLVLDIFVKSGLVMFLPAQPLDQYQLVHDYLSAFIRSTRESRFQELMARLKEEQRLRKEVEKSLAEVEQQKEAAQEDLQRTKRQTQRWATWGTAAGVVAAVGITGALTWAGIQTQTAKESATQQIEQATQDAQGQIDQATQRSQQIQTEADRVNQEANRVKLEANRDKQKAEQQVSQAKQELTQANAAKAKADEDVAAAQRQVEEAQGKSEQIRLKAERNLAEARRKQAEADQAVAVASYKLKATTIQITALNSQAAYNNDTLQALMVSLQAGAQYKALVPKGRPDCRKPDEKNQSLCNAYFPLMGSLQQVLYSSDKGLNTNRFQQSSSVWSVSWSPDGETIATGSDDFSLIG